MAPWCLTMASPLSIDTARLAPGTDLGPLTGAGDITTMAIATVRIASFDGATSYITQCLPNAVAFRTQQVLNTSGLRWTGRGLPPVTLTLLLDKAEAATITLSGVQVHPRALYRSIVAAVRAFEVVRTEGWTLTDTASDADTPQA